MGFLGEALNTVLNLDVVVMAAQSKVWAATEDLKAECRYQLSKVKEDSEEENEEKTDDVNVSEKQSHPEDDESEVVVTESVVENELQNGMDFTALQNVEVPLIKGTEYDYESTGHNPALAEINQENFEAFVESGEPLKIGVEAAQSKSNKK